MSLGRVVALPVAGALLLSACGGSGGGSGNGGRARTGTARVTRTVTVTTPGATATSGRGGTATTSTSTPTTNSGATTCTPKQLGIHYVRSGGAAGTVYETFAFVNVSSSACSLYGYPGVSLVLTSGQVDDITNVRDPSRPPKHVVVAPGARAPFVLGVHGPAAQPCVQARELRFIPPNDTAYEQITHPGQICGGSVVVSAVGYR